MFFKKQQQDEVAPPPEQPRAIQTDPRRAGRPGPSAPPSPPQVHSPFAPAALPGPPGQQPAALAGPLGQQPSALLLLSSDRALAEELHQMLVNGAGQRRYMVTYVETYQGLWNALTQHPFIACLFDLASSVVQQLGIQHYHALGNLPYLALLTTPTLNEDDPLRQGLERLGYHGYVGYPLNSRDLQLLLEEVLQDAAPPPPMAPPAQAIAAKESLPTPAPSNHREAAAVMADGVMPAVNRASVPAAPPVQAPAAPPVQNAPTVPPVQAQAAPAVAVPAPAVSVPSIVPPPPMPPVAQGMSDHSVLAEPQIIKHRGLFVCWSAFDDSQRTVAALNLATALAMRGFRTLVGELRRPAGPLRFLLQLSQDELSRSLLAAAQASEQLLAQQAYALDKELLENSLLNAIPLNTRDEDSPEIQFFLSGPPMTPQALFTTPALDPNHSSFIPDLLQMFRQYWDFAFIIIGSNPVDTLHWQALKACDRLLLFLPPDAEYLMQTEQLLQATMRTAKISRENVDVILTQLDRGAFTERVEGIQRLLEQHPRLEDKHLRYLERQFRRLGEEESARRHTFEPEVTALLKACGLENAVAGVLPDALPLMRRLRRSNRLLLPALMQPEFANTPYARAIRELLGTWVEEPRSAVGETNRRKKARS